MSKAVFLGVVLLGVHMPAHSQILLSNHDAGQFKKMIGSLRTSPSYQPG